MKPSTSRRAAALLISTALLAACGGGDKSADTTAAPSSSSTTTTEAPSTTAAPSSAESTTTVAPAVPVMPLTGMPITDQALADRAALVVKIDNHPQARPQEGLNEADIVFEENVEQLTRFAAVFQTGEAAVVGPIRSGRSQDIDLLGAFNQPLLVWSGGNPTVQRMIDGSDLFDIGVMKKGTKGYYRDNRGRRVDSEHTLFGRMEELRANAPADRPAPPQQFQYRDPATPAGGAAAAGADVTMDGVKVAWRWNPDGQQYLREQDGKVHETTGGQVNATNVVVLEMEYVPSPADSRSPEAQTIGTGKAWVYTGGNVVEGTWTRDDRLKPFTLTDSAGAPILLAPGRTWVELARPGANTTVAG